MTTTAVCHDVTWFARPFDEIRTNRCYSVKMAESVNPTLATTRRGGKYCVAGLTNNVSCTNTSYSEGISMHRFPKNPETRQKWKKFVRKRQLDFTPTDTSSLCSMHFLPTCYTRRQDITVDGIEPSARMKKILLSGAVPTEDGLDEVASVPTARARRQVCPLPWLRPNVLIPFLILHS